MNKATFDPARRLDLYFRCARDGSKDFVFTYSDGTPYSFIYEEFQFYIYRYQGEKKVLLELLTVSNQDTLTSSITVAQSNIDAAEYYYELFNSQTNETWLCGDAIFHNGKFDGVSTDTEDVTIQINGEEINITLEVTPASASGTVTSVGALSPLFTTANPTTTPTFTAVNQNANLFYAGPATGGAAAPTFRALVAADLPSINISSFFYRNNVTSSLTGTLTETVLDAACLITAGTLQANDVIRLTARSTRAGANGTVNLRFRVNTTPVVAGSTQLSLTTHNTTQLYGKMGRDMVFKNSLASQDIYSTTTNGSDDTILDTNALSSLTIDFSVDQYIFPTAALANAADTLNLRSWGIQIITKT